MRISTMLKRGFSVFVIACLVCLPAMHFLLAQSSSQVQTKILGPEDIGTMMPATVFFRGQSASVQLRNACGLRFSDGPVMLAVPVDTSGYSSGLQEKYQGYMLSETILTINGRTLSAGAYGFGFLANNNFVVMDIGGHDILQVAYQKDAAIPHPRPLTIIPGKTAGSYRLYEGRNFVSIRLKRG